MKTSKEIWDTEVTKYTSKWNSYFNLYDQWFAKFRDQKPTVVEIGIYKGGSLEGWKSFFGEGSTIIGVDNVLRVGDVEGCKIVQGDQSDPIFWDVFCNEFGPIDVLIDDGSHHMQHQITTFEKVFPFMKEDGVYFVEDTHTSYMPEFGGQLYRQSTFIEYMKRIVDCLHHEHINLPLGEHMWFPPSMQFIKGVHFYDSVVVVEKELQPRNFVTYTNREKS